MKIGILGAGQLAKMLALCAYRFGFTVRTFSPDSESPCDGVTERVKGDYSDRQALSQFISELDLVTYEFENIPVATLTTISSTVALHPNAKALEISCDRIREKSFLNSIGIPTPKFKEINSSSDLEGAASQLGLPLVVKTRTLGYDGKGQRVVRTKDDIDKALSDLGTSNLIAEQFIPFSRELSVIGARNSRGEIALYPLFDNTHSSGILSETIFPAQGVTPDTSAQAHAYLSKLLNELSYIGICTLELFDCGGNLLANEMAPRVHNSGHGTIEGACTSQFENHIRAITGLPLGSTAPIGSVRMLNVIGVRPDLESLLKLSGAHVHWYGKTPRPGRKVGHVTVTDSSSIDAARRLIRNVL